MKKLIPLILIVLFLFSGTAHAKFTEQERISTLVIIQNLKTQLLRLYIQLLQLQVEELRMKVGR